MKTCTYLLRVSTHRESHFERRASAESLIKIIFSRAFLFSNFPVFGAKKHDFALNFRRSRVASPLSIVGLLLLFVFSKISPPNVCGLWKSVSLHMRTYRVSEVVSKFMKCSSGGKFPLRIFFSTLPQRERHQKVYSFGGTLKQFLRTTFSVRGFYRSLIFNHWSSNNL